MRYEAPETLDAAVNLLAGESGDGRILSGGTDLLVQMRAGILEPDLIVDIKNIPGMRDICYENGGFRIGSAVSCAELNEHAALKAIYPGVCEGADRIGSTQIQGRATMAGNLCNAGPAADSIPCLVAVGATATLSGPCGTRHMAIEDIPRAPGKTALEKGEIVAAINLPAKPARTGDAYLRFIPRTEMDIAVVGCGVSLTLDETGICIFAKLALAAVAAKVVVVKEAAKALVGTPVDDAALENLAAVASAACKPINDKRGTIEFRTKVAAVLAKRATRIALARARS